MRYRWQVAYYISLAVLAVGIVLFCLGSRNDLYTTLGAAALVAGGLIRWIFCRCPRCGAAIMRMRRDNCCPRCQQSLEN